MKVAVASTGQGLEAQASMVFGRCPYFVIVDVKNNEIKNSQTIQNPAIMQRGGAGLAAAHFIVKEKADAMITKEIGEISFHTLRDHLVDIYTTQGETVQDIINNFIKNKLKRLNKPTKRKD